MASAAPEGIPQLRDRAIGEGGWLPSGTFQRELQGIGELKSPQTARWDSCPAEGARVRGPLPALGLPGAAGTGPSGTHKPPSGVACEAGAEGPGRALLGWLWVSRTACDDWSFCSLPALDGPESAWRPWETTVSPLVAKAQRQAHSFMGADLFSPCVGPSRARPQPLKQSLLVPLLKTPVLFPRAAAHPAWPSVTPVEPSAWGWQWTV